MTSPSGCQLQTPFLGNRRGPNEAKKRLMADSQKFALVPFLHSICFICILLIVQGTLQNTPSTSFHSNWWPAAWSHKPNHLGAKWPFSANSVKDKGKLRSIADLANCSPGGDSRPGVAHLRGQGVRLQQRGAEVAGQRGSRSPSGGRGAFGAGKVSAAGVAQQDVHPFPPQLWAAGRSNVYCDSPRVAQYVLHSSHIDVSPNSLSVLSSQITSEQFLGNLSADRSAKKTGALAVSWAGLLQRQSMDLTPDRRDTFQGQ